LHGPPYLTVLKTGMATGLFVIIILQIARSGLFENRRGILAVSSLLSKINPKNTLLIDNCLNLLSPALKPKKQVALINYAVKK